MRVAVYVDEDDRMSTPVHLRALNTPEDRRCVAHLPTDFDRLPFELLLALGHRSSAPDWPMTPALAWRMCRAWLIGFGINELILYGAWRLSETDLARLVVVGQDLRISRLSLVAPRLLIDRAGPLAALESAPLSDLLSVAAETPSGRAAPAPRLTLPPLPAADFLTFEAECVGWLDGEDLQTFIDLWAEARYRAHVALKEAIGFTSVDHDRVIGFICRGVRQASDSNDVLVSARALQTVALGRGVHVAVGLSLLMDAAAAGLGAATTSFATITPGSRVHPFERALAALAVATQGDAEMLTGVRVDDLDHSATSIDLMGRKFEIQPELRPALRAQRHLVLGAFGAPDMWLLTSRGTRPGAGALSRRLDEFDATAARALGSGERLEHRISRALEITDLRGDHIAGPAGHEAAPHGAQRDDFLAGRRRDGHPDVETKGRTDIDVAKVVAGREDRKTRASIAFLLGGHPSASPTPRRIDASTATPADTSTGDAQRLHALLLLSGGEGDIASAVRGFGWSPRRLEHASKKVNQVLSPLHARVAVRPDGELRLVTCEDHEVVQARQTFLRRQHALKPLSTTAARVIWSCVTANHRSGVPVGQACDRSGQQRSVLNELIDAGYVVRTAGATARVSDDVRAALGLSPPYYRGTDRACG